MAGLVDRVIVHSAAGQHIINGNHGIPTPPPVSQHDFTPQQCEAKPTVGKSQFLSMMNRILNTATNCQLSNSCFYFVSSNFLCVTCWCRGGGGGGGGGGGSHGDPGHGSGGILCHSPHVLRELSGQAWRNSQ